MDSAQARIRASVIHIIAPYATAHGIDFPTLLDDVGLSRDLLDDHIVLVPLASVLALFERAAERLNDPCFGLHLSETVRPGSSGILGQLAITAPDVRTSLETMARFGRVQMTKFDLGFREADGRAYAHWKFPDDVTTPGLQFSALISSILIRRLKEAIGETWKPLKCEFAHRAFDGRTEAEKIFGDNLEFGQPQNEFTFARDVLDKPMPHADPMMFAVYVDLAERWEKDLEAEKVPDVVVAAKGQIVEVLSSDAAHRQPDLNRVAKSLGVGPRVLQRRLDQADTTFEKLLIEIRTDLAKKLLLDTDKSISDIAFALGYSDQSVFTRAAQRWFNMSPKQFRQHHRTSCG